MKILTRVMLLSGMLMVLFTKANAQAIYGQVSDANGHPIEGATVRILRTQLGAPVGPTGQFRIDEVGKGTWNLRVHAMGYTALERTVVVGERDESVHFILEEEKAVIDEVVVSGTMREVSKLQSPIPVEVFTSKFFKSNPAPSIFESLQTINGVRPQINCSVCNTGDIHINGLEGPYTMVMVDGMPIVSGLSTVYGLTGIPQFLIERVEVVKGPASTLYGSEAVGGLINIITKNPSGAPRFSVESFATNWAELNFDVGGRFSLGTGESLIGVNYFNYSNPIDNNNDGFTDVTLQDRFSLFNKWNFLRADNKVFSLAARYVYEDRWGGEMNWNRSHRRGDDVYGESIYTKRWEAMGVYDLPGSEDFSLMFSVNGHDQNSVYGETEFMADQRIAFGQLSWQRTWRNHHLLTGLAYRYTYYDDNTPATATVSHTHLPGLFVQDEIAIGSQHTVLLGARYDYNSVHGSIVSPRASYKWSSADETNVLRVGLGNGYRVANVFTEDHAALTGSRNVVFEEDLQPETSWNANVNYVKRFFASDGSLLELDASGFYTYFFNKIIPDYESDVSQIRYANLEGYAVSQGLSLNIHWIRRNGLKASVGGTLLDVFSEENGVREWQMLSERFMGTWNIGYHFKRWDLTVDYTGNVIGPMRLPVLGAMDPRPSRSKTWSLQNIQVGKPFGRGFEVFGGVKNLLNWTPNKDVPFLIARTNDPFDKNVQFDSNNEPMVTPDNPYGLTFDPAYVYAPNQGIRGFIGFRYHIF